MRRLTLLAVLLLACSGDDDETDPSAPGKCEAFSQTFCGRVAQCRGGTDLNEQQRIRTECDAAVKTQISCAKAIKIGPTYGNCLADLQNTQCSVFLPNPMGQAVLPKSCEGQISYE